MNTQTMPDETPSNVKVFDRPEKKGLSPVIISLIVLAVLALGFLGYRAFFMHPAAAPAVPRAQTSRASSAPYPANFATGNFAGILFAQG